MKLDDEMKKHLDLREIKCPCGSDIILTYELASKMTNEVTQFMLKCSNNKSPENIVCGRTGMIWKKEMYYNWD